MTTQPHPAPLRELARHGDAYRFLLAEADLGVLVIAGVIEDCNDAACRLFGRSREALVGSNALELSPPVQPDGTSSATAATQRLQSALAGLPQWFEWRFQDENGEPVDTIVHVEAVLVDGRRRVLLRLRNLSHLQRAESRLRDTETRLQQILDNSTNALVYAKDRTGRYLFVNRAFERLFGMPAENIVGKTPADLFPPDVAERLMRNDVRAIEERRAIEVEEVIHVGDVLRTEISNKFPLLDRDGTPYAVCGISVDITARTRVEQAMRRAALAVSAVEGEGLFGDLVRSLAEILAVDIAFIALPVPSDARKLRMLAFCVDGNMIEDFEYGLDGTPCETVLGQQYRIYPSRLINQFPLDSAFRDMGVDAYAGYPLTGALGRPLGLISVVSRRPLTDTELVEAMLKIFATRAVTEIERRRADEALEAAEASYRAIFDAGEDPIFVHDWDTCAVVDVNAKACEVYGYPREELLSISINAISSGEPPYTSAEAVRWIEEAKRTGAVQFEWRRKSRDGTLHWDEVRLKAAVIGGSRRILAFAREITERKLAEEALSASEAQYRAIFQASADALILWDSHFRRVDVNPAYERIYGWARDEVIGRGYEHPAYPPEYARRRLDLVRRTLAGETCHAELEAIRKNGERFQTEVHTIPFQHRGEPHVLAISRDITERKLAEEALRANEAQYRAIFNASADALVLRDADFRIVDVNSTYEAWTGIPREQAVGINRVLANPPGVNERVKALHGRVLAGEPIQFETQLLHTDGSSRELELRGMPIRHRGVPHVLYAGRDITERKRAESERQALEAQLRQAQKMEAIGHLTGGIAHDFNNILTSILGYIVLAQERDAAAADQKLIQYLEQAQRASLRARDLIQQMLTFSRGRRGEPRALNLPPLVRDALKLIGATLPSSLVVNVELEREVPPVMADPVQAEQVLLNLLINARDAMNGIGAIDVSVGLKGHAGVACASCRKPIQGRFVTLAVRDSGSGIAPEALDRIFDPFFTTKGVGKGSGMGLSTVHGIVHECGGHVTVDSTPGAGATFRILFPPLLDAHADSGTAAFAQADHAPHAPRMAGRVLVVDDEVMVGEFVAELLESRGLDVTVKDDPLEAARWFSENPDRVDLVLTDQTMPRMTGLELAQRLATERPELPVILYTGYGEDISPDELRRHGVAALLKKPLEPASLVALLRSHLRQA